MPSLDTLVEFHDALRYVLRNYRVPFCLHWGNSKARAAIDKSWHSCTHLYYFDEGEVTSDKLMHILETLHEELLAALPSNIRTRTYHEVGKSIAHLCFAASLHFQSNLLTRVARKDGYDRPVLSGIEHTVCTELVSMWKHAFWFVQYVNAAQPELHR